LLEIHSNNIIHRDIKPENLIFKDKLSYDLKIVDYGLSEFVNDPDCLYKRSGTPGYVAPEILKD
jgi:calcium-dependent protein kinase